MFSAENQGPLDHPDWGVIRRDGRRPTETTWQLATHIALTFRGWTKGITADPVIKEEPNDQTVVAEAPDQGSS